MNRRVTPGLSQPVLVNDRYPSCPDRRHRATDKFRTEVFGGEVWRSIRPLEDRARLTVTVVRDAVPQDGSWSGSSTARAEDHS